MNFLKLILLFFLCLGTSIVFGQDSLTEHYDNTNSFISKGTFKNNKKEGIWLFYHENGEVSETGSYLNNQKTGLWQYYDDDGALSKEGHYENNRKVGFWTWYLSDGSISSSVNFDEDFGGVVIMASDEEDINEYYSSGQLKIKRAFNEKGQLHGKYETYYEDGTLQSVCQFINGNVVGEYIKYHQNGTLFEVSRRDQNGDYMDSIVRYHKDGNLAKVGRGQGSGGYRWVKGYDIEGRLITEDLKSFKWMTYTDDGYPYRSGEYLDGAEHGTWAWYHDDSDQISFIFFKQTNKKVRYIAFYENGHLKATADYEGEQRIEEKDYFEDGKQLKSIKKYQNGRKHGQWLVYNKSAQVLAEEYYENGQAEGNWLYYYEIGQLKNKFEFKAGNETGIWEYYSEEGNLYKEVMWHKNKIIHYYEDGEVRETEKIFE